MWRLVAGAAIAMANIKDSLAHKDNFEPTTFHITELASGCVNQPHNAIT
jgi:hypothetical protein